MKYSDLKSKLIAEIEDLYRDISDYEEDIYICGYKDGSNEAINDVLYILNKHLSVEELDAL